MARAPLEIITGGNVYIEELSMHLQLDSWKLPKLSREMEDIFVGLYKMQLPAEVSPLESEMETHGNPEAIRSRFGREPGDWTTIRYYEASLDASKRAVGDPLRYQRVVMIKGLLSEVDQPGVSGAKAKDKTKSKWGSIILYQDIYQGRTIHKFAPLENTLIIDGKNYTAELNNILAI